MKIVDLYNAREAIAKLYRYGEQPAAQLFYLNTLAGKAQTAIDAYGATYNSLLRKYGESEDDVMYDITDPEKIEQFQKELADLNEQDAGFSFDPERITLCVDEIERREKDLPNRRWLAFSAIDWGAIQKVIKVVEKEE